MLSEPANPKLERNVAKFNEIREEMQAERRAQEWAAQQALPPEVQDAVPEDELSEASVVFLTVEMDFDG